MTHRFKTFLVLNLFLFTCIFQMCPAAFAWPDPNDCVSLSLYDQGQLVAEKLCIRIDDEDPMEPLPKISCLMVAKGDLNLSRGAIQCFLNQTYPERELIIVDHSEEGSLKSWIEELNYPLIRYFSLPAQGQTSHQTWHFALQQAMGEFIAKWNEGDLHAPERLTVQMHALQRFQAEISFLEREFCWCKNRHQLFITESREWENSLLCRKETLPAHDPLDNEQESTPFPSLLQNHKCISLDSPFLYSQVIHGNAAWEDEYRSLFRRGTSFVPHAQYAEAVATMLKRFQFDKPINNQEDISWDTPLRAIANMHLSAMESSEMDRNWKLNDFFGSIFVINLPRATHRLKQASQELNDIGAEFEIFPAIDGQKEVPEAIWRKFYENRDHVDPNTPEGKEYLDRLHQREAGCYMSHYTILKNIKKKFDEAKADLSLAQSLNNAEGIANAKKKLRQYSRVLILEDDLGFGVLGINSIIHKEYVGVHLRQALRLLPDDWDIFYFMTVPSQPTMQYSKNLYKMAMTWSATAYAVNYTMYDRLIQILQKIEDPREQVLRPIDVTISETHCNFNVYAIHHSIVFVHDFPSQISDHFNVGRWQRHPTY